MIKENKELIIKQYLEENYNYLMEMKENNTLEDFYNLLSRNKPHHKSKLYQEWNALDGLVFEELLIQDEHPRECEELINDIINYLQDYKKLALERWL